VLVTEQSPGYLTLLRDTSGSGRADWIERHVEDLNRPYGLAWRDDHLLVTDQDGIWRVPHILGALRAGRAENQRIDQVPPEQRKPVPGAYGAEMLTATGVFGIVQGHQNRALAIDPKSGALFVGVGSSGNLGIEPLPKASIQRFDPNGSNQMTFASGMRNPTALAFHPQTASCGPWCRSAMVSAIGCRPTTSPMCSKADFMVGLMRSRGLCQGGLIVPAGRHCRAYSRAAGSFLRRT